MEAIFAVGQPFPLDLPKGEGCVMNVLDDGTFFILAILSHPSKEEVRAFENPWLFGIFESAEHMPGGLPMIAVQGGASEDLLPQELPFDASLEASIRLDGMLRRVSGDLVEGDFVPSLLGILVDSTTGRVEVIKQIGPPRGWVLRLGELWSAQPGQGDYGLAYERLAAHFTTEQLWGLATKYPNVRTR